MKEDKNRYSGAFGDYYGNRVAEPKNITSDMWTPISVAPVKSDQNKKYIPENNREPFRQKPASDGRQKKTNKSKTDKRPSQQKAQQKQYDRPISQGREQKGKKPADVKSNRASKPDNRQNTASNKANNRNSAQRNPVQHKQNQPAKKTDAKQGRAKQHPEHHGNPRAKEHTASRARQPMSQREYMNQLNNKKDVRRSNDIYKEKIDKGISHNEIMNENSAQKQKKRKTRNIISIIMAVVFVAAFIGVYSYSKGAPVQNVVVEGDSVYKAEQIISVSGIEKGDNMLGIKKKQVCSDIQTQLPYIYEATVDFKLPDTVTISVVSTTEKILLNNKNSYICLDENNKIVSLKKKKLTKGLYFVEGMEQEKVEQGTFYEPTKNNKDKFSLAKQIVSCLEQTQLITSAVINISDLTDVQITYESRIRIYLGKCEDVEAQLALAAEAIKHSASQKQKGYIDMRYSNTAYFAEGSMEPD